MTQLLAHLAAAALALYVGWHEHLRKRRHADLWPALWFATGGFLLLLVVGEIVGLGDFLANVGRDEAHATNWYGDRRWIQGIVAGLIGATWIALVVVAAWRFPRRRRRYLPLLFAVVTLVCFTGARLLSLHQLDNAFFTHHVGGLEVGDTTEATLLAIIFLLTLWSLRMTNPEPSPNTAHGDPRPVPPG